MEGKASPSTSSQWTKVCGLKAGESERETIAQERLKELQVRGLIQEEFSEEREFAEPKYLWQESTQGVSVTSFTVLNMGNEDGARLSENKFNAVIADPQPKFLQLPAFQFDYFSMLKRMIALADFFNLSHNTGLFFNGQVSEFLLCGGVKEIIEHENGRYLEDFSRFLRCLSTSLAGIQEPVRSAAFTRASAALTDSGEDNSMKSTTSSNSSLERILDGAITPRRLLSSIIVKDESLFITSKYNTFLNNLSRRIWESYFGAATITEVTG